MNKDLLNILVHSNREVDNQLLMDYISGHLSATDQHHVEEWLEENEFAADAMDGLKEFGNKDQLNEYVAQLNRELKHYILHKKEKREKRRWKDNPWTALALILVLAIIVLTYVVLRMLGAR